MSTYVLIHGSWHDGTLWGAVATTLREAGHTVHTPTIAGHGKGADRNVNHDDCVQSIIDYYEDNDLTDTVLVGHSFGGTVIARLAEEIPDRIRRLVFHDAYIPEAGNSLLDETPPSYQDSFHQMAAASADNTVMIPFDLWRNNFIQDADLDLARSTYAMLSPEPFQPFIDKLALDRFYATELPKSYIFASEDAVMPPGEAWGWHPRMSNRLGFYRFVQMPGSHEVVFTNPSMLAQKIIEAGRD